MIDERDKAAPAVDGKAEEVAREAEHLVVEDMARYMSQFARSFEASARRWELVVYPFLLAFIILAGYGFFLIYKLTNDVDKITDQMVNVTDNMVAMTATMQQMTATMGEMSGSFISVNEHMTLITQEMADQNMAMAAIVASMQNMNQSMETMSFTMYQMRYDTSVMGNNVQKATGPMRFMDSFVPW